MSRDPELAKLLLDELERHSSSLQDGIALVDQKRALHSLKGSAAIAGERGFSEALGRLERRLMAGDPSAIGKARERIVEAAAAIADGRTIPGSTWPVPPEDLVPGERASLGGSYVTEMIDRLTRIDRVLSSGEDVTAASAAYREVHAMKGAALAAADEVTAWFCHGLEERLKGADKSEGEARRALAELTRWRGVLAEMIPAPARALETLRIYAWPNRSSSPPRDLSRLRDEGAGDRASAVPAPPLSQSRRPTLEPPSEIDREGTLRVATAMLDRFFERVRILSQARAEVSDGSAVVSATSARARQLRMALGEALRLIGPPRPWGAPAAAIQRIEETSIAIAAMAERLETKSAALKEAADRIRVEADAAHADLASIRTTKVASLFERVSAAALAEARREGREVRFTMSGEELAIDRRVVEELFDPVLQLARNAVAHGIETAAERALRGKPRVGVVQLRAESRSGALRIIVRDDGAGVNASDVRARAVARGVLTADVARGADDQTLLALLFVPGFSTKESADLLAGRGVGLDVALDAVERLGGTIRLSSEPGMGLAAAIDVPIEPGIVRVLWIDAEGVSYALPAQYARRVLLGGDAEAARAVPLAACLRGERGAHGASLRPAPTAAHHRPFVIELDAPHADTDPPLVGVDRVGIVEEVALRAVSPLVASAGPYSGAVVRGTELRLCLDPDALAERTRAFLS